MRMCIPQDTQMSEIFRMAGITPTLLQTQGLIGRIGIIGVGAVAFFGFARAVGAAPFAGEEGTVGGEAGGEDPDVEFDHCPDVYGDVGPCRRC